MLIVEEFNPSDRKSYWQATITLFLFWFIALSLYIFVGGKRIVEMIVPSLSGQVFCALIMHFIL